MQNVAAPMNTPGSGGRFATLGDAYVDFLEKEGVVFKDSAVNSNATQPALGQSFTNDVVNSAGANGAAGGNGADYVNPKDYDSETDYAKALMDKLRTQMQTGNIDDLNDFLFLNGYDMGAEGLGAINQYTQGVLGQTGMAVYGEKEPTLTERIQQDQLEKYQPWQLGSGQDDETKDALPAWSGVNEAPTMEYIEAAKQAAQAEAEAGVNEDDEEERETNILKKKEEALATLFALDDDRESEKDEGDIANAEKTIDILLQAEYPDDYVPNSVKVYKMDSRELSPAMAKIGNFVQDAMLDAPFILASYGIAGASKIFKVGKHATDLAKATAKTAQAITSYSAGQFGGSIVGDILGVLPVESGKSLLYSAQLKLNTFEGMEPYVTIEVTESGDVLIISNY